MREIRTLRCDVEGAGNVVWSQHCGQAGAPVLDPTDERGVETELWSGR
jgi:hypothetical protein